jgi:hypothetical protein
MDLLKEQLDIIQTNMNTVQLVEGYSGVGKSTVLLHKFFDVLNHNEIYKDELLIVVKDDVKKIRLINDAKKVFGRNLSNFIMTLEELVNLYIDQLNIPLFKNRITDDRKLKLIDDLIYDDMKTNRLVDFEVLLLEIDYIQKNICIDEKLPIHKLLEKELQAYLLVPRKNSVRGLLTFNEKQEIWSIYQKFTMKALQMDFFDDLTLYQSFLRLVYHHAEASELMYQFKYLFVDDLQDFSKVECDILYHLLNLQSEYYGLFTLDPLKSLDRYHFFRNSRLYQLIDQSHTLKTDFLHGHHVFNILDSTIKSNNLFKYNLPYQTKYGPQLKSTLTFYYNKLKDEKLEVFFDRIDLLTNNLDFNLEDILIIFFDEFSYQELYEQCQDAGLPVMSIKERLYTQNTGLVFMRKEEIISVPFKVVLLYDADNKKIGNGAISPVININQNYRDSILFYTALSNAEELLLIQSSVSEPSTFLLPSQIDYKQFVFEIGSRFQIKSSLNVYRITDFIHWIREQMMKYYQYQIEDFMTHPIYDMIVQRGHERIAIKILDHNIDNQDISKIIHMGLKYDYIVIFDSHHYLVFRNHHKNFIRILDIPMKT